MDIGDLTTEQRLAWARTAALWDEIWQAPRILWAQWCDILIDTWMGSISQTCVWSSSVGRTR